jgi:hypothetical protein
LERGGELQAETRFPDGGCLVYAVASHPGAGGPRATFTGNRLTVTLPEAGVRDWAAGDAVSIAAEQVLDGGGSLRILVEKDFQCLTDRDDEDESDMYPHPQAGSQHR